MHRRAGYESKTHMRFKNKFISSKSLSLYLLHDAPAVKTARTGF